MTSKEINDMIIGFEKQIEQFGEMITLTNQLNILKSYKQDLERLEVLEKENQELKKEYRDYQEVSIQVRNAFQISNRNLTQENEKLKQENKENAEFYVKSRDALWDLKQQNEKLKKVINIFNDKTNIGIEINMFDNRPYVYSDYGDSKITQQEYELLKEVLGNET